MDTTPSFWGLKLMNAFSMGMIGSAQVYLPIFNKKVLDLSTDRIGFIQSITPFMSCLAFPFWTAIVDKTQKHKVVGMTNMTVALVTVLCVTLVPSLTDDQTVATVLVSLCDFGFAFFGYPIIATMVDSITLRVLGDRKEQLYGRQKAFGPLGFGGSVFLTGLVMDRFGPYALFGSYAFFVISFLITAFFTSFEPYAWHDDEVDHSHSSRSSSFDGTVAHTDSLRSDLDKEEKPPTISDLLVCEGAARFFTVMTLLGVCMSVFFAFLTLFIGTDLHGSPALLGLLGPLGSSVEIVCFFFTKEIFGWLGADRMLLIGQAISAYRCVVYIISVTWFPDSSAVFATLTQIVHGASFSLIWSAGVIKADAIAPPGMKSRAQGLLGMVYFGLGSGVGALLGGVVYEHYGSALMWGMVLVVVCLSAFVQTSSFLDRLAPTARIRAGYTAVAPFVG
ncbi:major facilitator superfamily domain-containing protein [Syncephalastrum racemosum]|uniref:Major facilitator superfamily domain-containing protein n=1 Tax=Syncephalastrum racemosum TaxID=13706 RepID=A0A1X2H4M7_SYNRA|nr:major facilitator superfamily domain-containing protein [Syncephalastrum racemosum]